MANSMMLSKAVINTLEILFYPFLYTILVVIAKAVINTLCRFRTKSFLINPFLYTILVVIAKDFLAL